MPRLITCIDQQFGDEPLLDSAAFWVRLPDGTRAADPSGKLLAFKYRENAAKLAREVGGKAVPPEGHELVAPASVPAASPKGKGVPSQDTTPPQRAALL